jgi:hypothetical protein
MLYSSPLSYIFAGQTSPGQEMPVNINPLLLSIFKECGLPIGKNMKLPSPVPLFSG